MPLLQADLSLKRDWEIPLRLYIDLGFRENLKLLMHTDGPHYITFGTKETQTGPGGTNFYN